MKDKKNKFQIASKTHEQLLNLSEILNQNCKIRENQISLIEDKMDALMFTENLILDFIFKENFTLEDLISFSESAIKDESLKQETIEFFRDLQEIELEEDEIL